MWYQSERIKQHNKSCFSSIIQESNLRFLKRNHGCYLKKKEDVELKEKRSTIAISVSGENHQTRRRRSGRHKEKNSQRLSNDGQSLGSEISANLQMRAKRKPAQKSLWRSKGSSDWTDPEILGLMRSDGIEIQRCYLDYLEALVSHYKAARSSRNPTGGYEGIRRFEDYHGDGNMDGSLAAKEKGRVEHFGITLKEEEEGKHKLMHTSYCQ
ncbi:hypothetical protein Tco_0993106 [Tanacetum coccineum]|uniref:Uncharacterized protein n=2 Tax=Tanacetum coccineum TaxID=301880 RepID=A0ABQ5F487_9ASTR